MTNQLSDDFKFAVYDLLLSTKAQITFKKVNGKIRKMNATLVNKSDWTQAGNNIGPACKVWDADKKAWRSFKWNNFKSIKVVV